MAKKLRWTVDEAPTGPYRSFSKRAWPRASYGKDGKPAAHIVCVDSYRPANAKSGDHPPLSVHVAKWRDRDGDSQTFDWRRLKAEFATLADAKAAAERFLDAHPEFAPKE